MNSLIIDEISTHGSRYPFASLPELKETLRFHLVSYYGYLVRRYAAVDLVSPRTATGWNTLGVSESRRGEYGKGLFCYRQALRLDPHSRDALRNLIRSLIRLGRLQEAEKETRKAIELQPDPVIRRLLCTTLRHSGKLEEALRQVEELTKIYPDDDRLWNEKFLIYSAKQDFQAALKALQKAASIARTQEYRRRVADLKAYLAGQKADLDIVDDADLGHSDVKR